MGFWGNKVKKEEPKPVVQKITPAITSDDLLIECTHLMNESQAFGRFFLALLDTIETKSFYDIIINANRLYEADRSIDESKSVIHIKDDLGHTVSSKLAGSKTKLLSDEKLATYKPVFSKWRSDINKNLLDDSSEESFQHALTTIKGTENLELAIFAMKKAEDVHNFFADNKGFYGVLKNTINDHCSNIHFGIQYKGWGSQSLAKFDQRTQEAFDVLELYRLYNGSHSLTYNDFRPYSKSIVPTLGQIALAFDVWPNKLESKYRQLLQKSSELSVQIESGLTQPTETFNQWTELAEKYKAQQGQLGGYTPD